MNTTHNILHDDLNHILQNTDSLWQEFKDQKILITGGTGFIGTWLLETLAHADQQLNLNFSVTVLTRNIAAFKKKAPHLTNRKCFQFLAGDVRNFTTSSKEFSHIIHAATDASKELNDRNPQLMLNTIVEGTKQTLQLASQCHEPKFLLLSSGAVYGKQPPHISHVKENHSCFSDESAYTKGKLTAELLSQQFAEQHHVKTKIARCFAFLGPYLPIDIHFAAGNFIRDGLIGNKIFVNGDGTAYRSYQYPADLVIWLLHILCRGASTQPYNVGSNQAISIYELAQKISQQFAHLPSVHVAKSPSSQPPERYVPCTEYTEQTLGLKNFIDLDTAIKKTIKWHQEKNHDQTH